jgi:cell division protein FtsX
MLNHNWQDQLAAPTRKLQIIVGALCAGCVLFMVIAIVNVVQRGAMANAAEMPIISYVALAMCASVVLASVVIVPTIVNHGCAAIAREQRDSTDSASDPAGGDLMPLVKLYTTKTIIGGALFEGATFFLLISYLVEGQAINLIAAMATIVAVALHFPTGSRMAAWIESKSDLIDEQRQSSA